MVLQIIEVKFSKLVISYQTRIKSLATELLQCHKRISSRSATCLFAVFHVDDINQLLLTLVIHECHQTLFNGILFKEIVPDLSNYIYYGIADTKNIIFHKYLFTSAKITESRHGYILNRFD